MSLSRARQAKIRWVNELYGTLDWDDEFGEELPEVGRFGVTAGAFGSAGGGSYNLEDIYRRLEELEKRLLEGGNANVKLYEDLLTADTSTSATLEAWTDLPGLTRTLAVAKPSLAWVAGNVTIECDALSDIADAECHIRFLLNGNPTSGHSRWSVTDSDIRRPGKSDKGRITIPIQTTFKLNPGTAYTIKIQIANFNAATTYTAVNGNSEGIGADSNMVTLLVIGTRADETTGGTKTDPTAESDNYVKVLDFCYDESTDEVVVARIRGEWDDGVPATNVSSSTPDRAYIEFVRYGMADLPVTATLGGFPTYKRLLADPSIWYDYYSWGMAANPTNGTVGICYTADEAGGTAYSQVYYVDVASAGGFKKIHEQYDGPNWHDVPRGDAVWCANKLYMVEPTTDTTIQNPSIPFKSGKRVTERSGDTGEVLQTWAIECEAAHRVRWPISLSTNGTTVELLFVEVESVSVSTYYLDDVTGISGGGAGSNAVTFDVISPAEMGSMRILEGISPDYMTMGDDDILRTWDPGTEAQTEWEDLSAYASPVDNKIGVDGSGGAGFEQVVVFVRGAEGNARTEPWLILATGP